MTTTDHPGTEVTCRDLLTGESESAIVRNDYVLVTDGDCYLANVQEYANATVVLTVKRRDAGK